MGDVMASSSLRAPRALVKINDSVVPGWIEWEVSNNTFYEADTFRVAYALQAMKGFQDMASLSATAGLKVQIYAGIPADPNRPRDDELRQLIEGMVDDLHFDPVQGRVELSGRDYTSRFIDARLVGQWRNQTASEVAAAFAAKHQLSSAVVPTTVKIGHYYDADHGRLGNSMSEWDFLTWLAGESLTEEGRKFVVYVRNSTLYFEPEPSPESDLYDISWSSPSTGRPYPQSNVMSLSFSRNLTVLRDIVVVANSWNRKQKRRYSATYPSSGGVKISAGGATVKRQVYTRKFTDLMPDQLKIKAQAIHRQLSSHEVKLEARMPADDALTANKLIRVGGTGTGFDQVYYPDNITRSFSLGEGYVMVISAKNHNTSDTRGDS